MPIEQSPQLQHVFQEMFYIFNRMDEIKVKHHIVYNNSIMFALNSNSWIWNNHLGSNYGVIKDIDFAGISMNETITSSGLLVLAP